MSVSDPIAWTTAQRRVLCVIVAGCTLYLAVRSIRDRATIADPQPARPAREMELADRVDPNTATPAMLAAIPGMGEKRAADIVAYRDTFRPPRPGDRPFNRVQDLLRIRGVGVATIEQIRRYVLFPPVAPTTRPFPK